MSLQKVTYSFLPTAISNCALWLDGTDPAGNGVVPSAGSLSTWTDKSGKSNSPTSSSGTYPTYSPTSKCVTWNGGAAQLTFPTSLYPFVVGTAFTVFFVEQRTTGSENFIIRGTTQGTNQNLLIGHGGGSAATAWRFAFYGNDLDFTGLPTYATGEPATVSCFMYSKPNRTIYHNGAVSASVSDTNASDLASWSGAMIGGNSIWPAYYGNVFEMIIYSTSLTLAQRQQVEGYLAQKYSLTGSLPAGHPGLGQTTYRADYRKTNIMKAVPFYTQFSPRQIAGCSHWFDATDSSTITLSSGSLTQWNDKSGNGRNLTAVAGFANATVSSAFQNRLNVFNFSGNGLYRTSAGNVSYPLDVYIIVALKSLTTHVDVLGMGDTSSDNFNSLTFAESAASRWHNGSSFGARQTISTSDETSLSFLLIQWSIANGNYLLRRNGTQLIQASQTYSFNNSATAAFQIGFRHTNIDAANFSGYIGEIIVFNNQIGTTDRQNVESYLTQKWGLVSSLPGGHLHLTKQAGAITPTALSKFRITSIPKASLAIPQTIAGLAMWLDATKITGFANGATLTSWTDSIGNLSFSNVNGVTYQTSIINGLPAVYMNGPGPYLEYSGTPPALVAGGTIYAVVQNNADGLVQPNFSGLTFQVLWQMNGYANGWEGYPYNFSSQSWLGTLATARRSWNYPFSSTYFKSPHIVKVVSTTNNWVQSFIQTATSTNASFTDTSASTPTLSAPMRLGACMDGPGLGYYKGYFAEIILYNRGLSAPEQTTIENYLKAKWNV